VGRAGMPERVCDRFLDDTKTRDLQPAAAAPRSRGSASTRAFVCRQRSRRPRAPRPLPRAPAHRAGRVWLSGRLVTR
jgi:hypothetical protein